MPPLEVSWVLFCRDILQVKSAAWNDKYTFYWKQLNEYINKVFEGPSIFLVPKLILEPKFFLDPKTFLDQTIFRTKWCLWEQIFVSWIFLGTKIYLDLYIISNSKFLFDSKKFWAPKIFFYYLFSTRISFTNYVWTQNLFWNEKAQTDGETNV